MRLRYTLRPRNFRYSVWGVDRPIVYGLLKLGEKLKQDVQVIGDVHKVCGKIIGVADDELKVEVDQLVYLSLTRSSRLAFTFSLERESKQRVQERIKRPATQALLR